MRALSIRQPYAELILRGIKPIEFRTRPTKIIGERFYIYASQKWAEGKLFLEGCGRPRGRSGEWGVRREEKEGEGRMKTAWSDDLAMPGEGIQPWMEELARMLILKDLPMGVIVGSAVITECRSQKAEGRSKEEEEDEPGLLSSDLRPLTSGLYEWHLGGVERAKKLRKPKGQPQPVWFNPFG
jgi:hypothetical protein